MRSAFKLELPIGGQYSVDDQSQTYVVRNDSSETAFAVGEIRATLSKRSGALKVDIPFTTADQLYYSRDSGKLRISNDLRALYNNKCEADPRGFYSLLQFGATVPPVTLWKEIGEFIPGRRVTINADGQSFFEQDPAITWPATKSLDHSLEFQSQVQILTDLIDQILVEACPNKDPIILFSGGVDSGVIAGRAAAMGWKDATLVNYSFGGNDDESTLAEKMAKHLGLGFVRTSDQDHDSLEVLGDIAEIFLHPFGDPSSSPTYALARAVIDRFSPSRVILDGTGADGAFGLFSKVLFYKKLNRIPQVIRQSVGYIYGAAQYWTTVSSVERIARILRRSSQLPMYLAGIARNPLANIAYHVRPDIRREVLELTNAWVNSTVISRNIEAQLPATDLALNCSRVLAQKTKSVFNAYERKVVYPFLDSRMVGLALQRARYWPGRDEPKKVLKAILASHVPSDMAYRPKSAFIGPYRTIFSRPEFLRVFDRLLAHKTALTEFVDLSVLKKLRDRVQSQTPLPDQTYWFIWTVIFAHCWLEQLERRSSLEGNTLRYPHK